KEEEEPAAVDTEPLVERVRPGAVASKESAADLARWASDELQKKSPRAPPPSSPRMFGGVSPSQSRSPIGIIVVLVVLAAAALVLGSTLGGTPPPAPPPPAEKPVEKKESPVSAVPTKPDPPPAAEKPVEAKPPEKPPPEKPAPQGPPTGLTADQVRKKL